ncbi:MAG: hypothetical protein ACHQ7M_22530, partial [Chloroflexota bacterium]
AYAHAGDRLAIVASGGVLTGRDAFTMLQAGAGAVQIYSALIFRGWRAPVMIARELAHELEVNGIPSLADWLRERSPSAALVSSLPSVINNSLR